MAIVGFGVRLHGFNFEDSHLTFLLASGITKNDVGKAVALDTSAPNQVKLAGDGDTIVGRLVTVEPRVQEGITVGAVALRFANKMKIKSGLTGAAAVVRGSTVVGAGDGEIRARHDGEASPTATPDHNINFVTDVIGDYAVVVQVR